MQPTGPDVNYSSFFMDWKNSGCIQQFLSSKIFIVNSGQNV